MWPYSIYCLIEEYELIKCKVQHKERFQLGFATINHMGKVQPYFESISVYNKFLDIIIMCAEYDLGIKTCKLQRFRWSPRLLAKRL
jgi:hypothetical protein